MMSSSWTRLTLSGLRPCSSQRCAAQFIQRLLRPLSDYLPDSRSSRTCTARFVQAASFARKASACGFTLT